MEPKEVDWPICSRCRCDIISVTPSAGPWRVLVQPPQGDAVEGGTFCISCMVEFAKQGVQLHDISAIRRSIRG
jgi:hypothetical protein